MDKSKVVIDWKSSFT